MDGLLAEISAKRKALELPVGSGDNGASGGGPSAKKYLRRADIERMREEEEQRKKEEEQKRKERLKEEKDRAGKMRKEAEQARLASLSRLAASPTPSTSARATPEPGAASASGSGEREAFNISPEECIRRLRLKGQPIRLFGESDKERRLRLRALELLEERSGGSHHGRNDFKKALEEMESGLDKKEVEKKARELHRLAEERVKEKEKEGTPGAAGGTSGNASEQESGKDASAATEEKKRRGADLGVLDLGLIKSDPNKLYPLIYYALKNVVKEWEEWMDNRPEEIKRSTQGKVAATLQVQSAQNLKPLFRSLRSRELTPDVVRLLAEIVHHMQSRSYQRANDAYLRLSIGNAAWPIGVTSVGIHERSAREKIGQDNIAHVLNDEVSRKYIQAVKRLLTFSQTIRPPEDVSQLMG
ncbi:hypothetical protein CI109_105828 [Kwoniella shandongensis]|uniref:Pre-mRNA-splicing factor 18 n=1 Tax=Kwoniella shandongensis TaxID=1734106 RepID=A0A5M6BSZ5_9TREE|nr:uncharacterized protein CI109_005736 [Kwoniella shandongensis]KAA5525988.1 hypothetical protein CI109_005736 [Kwoniella shandongensis]